MLRSLSVVEITPKVGLRRKWLGEVPFCLFTDISKCDSISRDFSSTSKAMVKPVPYFINTGSQTWIKCSKRFSEVFFITTGDTHGVSCWARFQPSTARVRGVTRGHTISQAPNHYGAPNHCGGRRKIPTMSQILSSIQHICFQKTSGSNMGRQTCFLPRCHLTSLCSRAQCACVINIAIFLTWTRPVETPYTTKADKRATCLL